MRIVGFGHRQRVGKDTAVRLLHTYTRLEYPKVKVCRCSFGDQIKDIAEQMYRWAGLKEGIYYENHPKEKDAIIPALGKSPRQIWIELGYAGQQINDRTWPEMAFSDADADLLLVPDMRRLIETEYVRKFKGLCIRLDRNVPKSDDLIDRQLGDYTDWDYIIDNNGTVNDLNDQLVGIFESWWNQ